jgi:hypothetical protein
MEFSINEWNEIYPWISYDVNNGIRAHNITGISYTVDETSPNETTITMDSTTYPYMFRIGMKEDGDRVYVEKVKN